MKMKKVFIDGSAGTTGLRIAERLQKRKDLTLLSIDERYRKDDDARREKMNQADIVFFCLPDEAAKNALTLIENDATAVIDTSTAHRIDPAWTYGFPELHGQRKAIQGATRIANPGCHASGFIALVRPLTDCGVLSPDTLLSCFSLTGYTGGGKKMIAQYESADRPICYDAPRQYGLSQTHKHLPEMQQFSKLQNAPIFCPIVASFPTGMEVTVPIFASQTKATIKELAEIYKQYYQDGLVRFVSSPDADGLLCANALSGTDRMEISVFGNEERFLLTARFDNLGKGASGAAIQNMNLLLGVDETTGLIL
ncbi:MAG: N-acetyl-gamma-glutamyl-phosphate reductase [Clostridia bacterium]|nr:N-acetyl-gamma-glutamyl-phosphate reductase [Clostridia bacterium]